MPSYDAREFDPPAPVAAVTLRTRDGQKNLSDVMMLIDSGADVSLIPESSVGQLELEPEEVPDYELTAFDGSRSIARSVQCDLIFRKSLPCGNWREEGARE